MFYRGDVEDGHGQGTRAVRRDLSGGEFLCLNRLALRQVGKLEDASDHGVGGRLSGVDEDKRRRATGPTMFEMKKCLEIARQIMGGKSKEM